MANPKVILSSKESSKIILTPRPQPKMILTPKFQLKVKPSVPFNQVSKTA